MNLDQASPKAKQAIETINNAVAKNKTISLVTWTLTDYGESLLHYIAATILNQAGKSELIDIVYPSVKELVINATKANMKRVFFDDQKIDPNNPEDYDRGMSLFKQTLTEEMIGRHKQDFIDRNYKITVTFYYTDQVLNIKVKNNFALLKREEERIREKFKNAQSFSSLLDFYMAHGDDTEGAGLGITMVGIILDESGIDRHSFTVFVKPGYNETAARLEIPLSENYVNRREKFKQKMQETGKSADELRRSFRSN